ncbi:hypothetical protein HHI36_007278 [Cryptolaemus montrouzieri]|uniref:Uncharacterized protein n=1 Tax=Cryptolaemus montrouzieri TaxID=559131 RepID=A0ABD2MPW8_9CUCU
MNTSMNNKNVRVLATPSMLNKTNPEIFSKRPRPGGLLVDLLDEVRNQPDTSRTDGYDLTLDPYQTTSREYRLTSALEGSNWSLEASDNTEESYLGVDPLKDCLDMLAVTLSTIMFLAADAGQDLSREQLNWTIMYLKCVQDEFGNIPPNARGILNHMKHIFNNDLTQFEDKPMYVDESGRILDESQAANMSQTERVVMKVTHKPEEAEEAPAPAGEE